ncbi:MAG: aldo/keto reductase [Cyclobacteriaceae bacterium]|nr:aldo/keto reductase [Cyclobacteriaceae bacterium]
MERKRIHPDGPEFSRLITGVWRWKELSTSAIERLIHQSVDAGITTFDHADIYGDYSCEEQFGAVLKGDPSVRKKIQLVTKCGIKLLSGKRPQHRVKHYDTSREHIVASVEQSLKNLNTDYLDLLLLHRPDPLMHTEEVAEAFGLLKQNGKVLHFGVSNFTSTQFDMLQSYVHDPLVTNQVELSLFQHQALFDGTVDTLMKHRVSSMAWSPLGGGKFFSSSGGDDAVNIPLEKMASQYKCSVSQLLLAWLLRHPSGIFPILGTTNPDRIAEGAGAINIELDRQDWFEMLKVVTGHDVA